MSIFKAEDPDFEIECLEDELNFENQNVADDVVEDVRPIISYLSSQAP